MDVSNNHRQYWKWFGWQINRFKVVPQNNSVYNLQQGKMMDLCLRDRMEIHASQKTGYICLQTTQEQFNLFLQEFEQLKSMCAYLVDAKTNEDQLKQHIQFLNNLVAEHQNQIMQLGKMIDPKDHQFLLLKSSSNLSNSDSSQSIHHLSEHQEQELAPISSFQFHDNYFKNSSMPQNISQLSERSETISQRNDKQPSIECQGHLGMKQSTGQIVQELQRQNEELLCQITELKNCMEELQTKSKLKDQTILILEKKLKVGEEKDEIKIVKTLETEGEEEEEDIKEYKKMDDCGQLTIMQQLEMLQNALLSEFRDRVNLEQITENLSSKLQLKESSSIQYQQTFQISVSQELKVLQNQLDQLNQQLEIKRKNQVEYQHRIAEMEKDIEFLQACLDLKDSRLIQQIQKGQQLKNSIKTKIDVYEIHQGSPFKKEIDDLATTLNTLASQIQENNIFSRMIGNDSQGKKLGGIQNDFRELASIIEIQSECLQFLEKNATKDKESEKFKSSLYDSQQIQKVQKLKILQKITSFWKKLKSNIKEIHEETIQLKKEL